MRVRWVAACFAALVGASAGFAQPGETAEERAIAAIRAGEYDAAIAILRGQIGANGDAFVPRYNLAVALAKAGRTSDGMESLEAAVERGMVDRQRLERDEDLAPLRVDPRYRALLANWPRVLERHRDMNLAATRADFTQGEYRHTRIERLRIDVLSAMDEQSTTAARAQLELIFDWAGEQVFPELREPAAPANDPWVVVVLPSPRDFVRWAMRVGGRSAAGVSTIGGAYFHDEKRLVSQDLGPSLRHEFFHVLHWRSMMRLGQDHPVWVQEGLCSLLEDVEGVSAREMKPVASWRSNIVKRILPTGRLLKIGELGRTSRRTFTGDRPLAHYAQARTVFLYMWDRGVLGAWYARYTKDFRAEDAASVPGDLALAAVLGQTSDAMDRAYREWVRELPEVAEPIKPGAATIGVDVEAGSGDGPLIVGVPREILRGQRSPAAEAGLRVGDVILAVDGRPTADLNELVRIIGERAVGERVELTLRRGGERVRATVELTARRE